MTDKIRVYVEFNDSEYAEQFLRFLAYPDNIADFGIMDSGYYEF